MAVPLEWLDPRVSYRMNRPFRNVWDDGLAITLDPGYTDAYLENVPFSAFERHVYHTLGDRALMECLPEGCYGEYHLDRAYRYYDPADAIRYEWSRITLNMRWANEFCNEVSLRRARQEAV